MLSAQAPDYAAANPLEPWVQPMVYAGFAWQGVFLLTTFVLYAQDRWSEALGSEGVPPVHAAAVAPLLQVLTVGGVTMAALSASLHLLTAVLSGRLVTAGVEAVYVTLAIAGATGVVALVRGTRRSRRLPVVCAWAGSATMFAWGLWTAVTTMGVTPLTGGAPTAGLAQLAGLLGGFALAVAGLLALSATGVARPRG